MRLSTRRVGLIGSLLLLFSIGCARSSSSTIAPHALTPLDLFPLQVGNVWSYDVDTGEPSTTLAITRVEAIDGSFVDVRTGDTIVRYELLPAGIRVPPNDVWLIRAPLSVGATWTGRGDRTATLVSVDATAETPAGAFRGCVEIVEKGGRLELEVRTLYCPGVGPVVVSSTMSSTRSERRLTVTATLRGYKVSPF
jgi:hypothetical protein